MDRAHVAKKSLSDRRLFAPDLALRNGETNEIALSLEAAKHVQVLRLAAGADVELFDGRGKTCAARLVSVSRSGVTCALLGAVRSVEQGPRVVLVQCLPKGGKLDDIVRMTTELGVTDILLAVSSRCMLRGVEERSAAKIERLTRIAIEAARQSEQAFVPQIWPAQDLETVLMQAPAQALKLACIERRDSAFCDFVNTGEVWALVGPEGGLSAEDLTVIDRAGFHPVGLGGSILRTETAAVACVTLVLDRLRQRR